ncbi:peptidase inhibitor family I36 protein [Streptomyces sp. NPDC046870]|uniref:peptidase inhibitor family I36 protein n=1 Tax=Streptomyces sp. NPDC046870 TaxID=3155135 RepID=UPI00345279F3
MAVTGALLGDAFATPAAAADPHTCPQGKVCGWSGTNRAGTRTVLSMTPSCLPFTAARSVSNQTSYRVEWAAAEGVVTSAAVEVTSLASGLSRWN